MHNIEVLDEVKSFLIKDFIRNLQKKGFKASYINIVIKSLRAFFRYLLNEEYVNSNPMSKIRLLKEEKVIIQTFTDEEVSRMLEVFSYKTYLEARNKLIIAFFVGTGIRLSELISLEMDQVEDSVIRIFGKGRKWRYVSISPYLKKMIVRYERIRKLYFERIETSYKNFFLSRSGKPLTTVMVEYVVKEAGKRARVREQIRCSPHTFRHYAIQSFLRQGLDLYSVSKIVGHENIAITNRYLLGLQTDHIIEQASMKSPLSYVNKRK